MKPLKRPIAMHRIKNRASGTSQKQNKNGGLSTRKQKRKQERKQKKEKKNLKYLARFKKPVSDPEIVQDITTVTKHVKTKETGCADNTPLEAKKNTTEKKMTSTEEKKIKKTDTQSSKLREKKSDRGQKRLREEDTEAMPTEPYEDAVMAREQKQLRQLEKQLKLKKRKNLPKAFVDDGLDFLLDIVDPGKKELALAMEGSAPVEKKEIKAKKRNSDDDEIVSLPKKKRTVRFADEVETEDEFDTDKDSEEKMESENSNEEGESEEEGSVNKTDELEDSGSGEEEMMEDDNSEDMDHESEENDEDEDETAADQEDDDSNVKEDIYGRLVDKKGNLLSKGEGGKYIPPGKRAAMLAATGQTSEEMERIKKQMKGLLNRASESNMLSIANAIEQMYMQHSRASVNESLFTLVKDFVVSKVLSPERLVAEMAMLVAVLHGNVGSQVGAHFLQHASKLYDELRQQENFGEEHTIDNVVSLLCYLYNFKITHHVLLFDIMTQLVESFSEKCVELLLLILKTAGFYLRRDDPESLGNQISAIQQKARELEESGVEVPSRVRFMLEILIAVRNNNVRRVPGADIERTDRLRQLAGKFIRGGNLTDNQLNIGLKDLLQSDEKGRWWIVGSAWDGRAGAANEPDSEKGKITTTSIKSGAVSQELERLAKKLRINSDLRRSIFYVLMSSEDYEDAFQKVLQLGLKGHQEQEIVVVAVFCSKQESQYNPFYSFFLQKLASFDRRFMISIRFHMWDMFKTLDELSTSSRKNLALLLSHLLSTKSLSLSVLKVFEFGILSKSAVKFLNCVFAHMLSTTSLTDLKEIFKAVCRGQKFGELVAGLKIFFIKYMKVDGEDKKKLVEVCDVLSQNHDFLM